MALHRAKLGERPDDVSISLHHHEGSDWLLLRKIAEEAVARACAGKALPELALNGAGMFVAGGPSGDNGTTGKKLVMDAYGPTVPIGGGAWSGKDLNKVDRASGMLARELALMAVKRAKREARVELRYEPGGTGPAAVVVWVDGRAADPEPDGAAGKAFAGDRNCVAAARFGRRRPLARASAVGAACPVNSLHRRTLAKAS